MVGVLDNKFKNKLYSIHHNAMVLKKIREITNECLSNGAYSSKNEIEQMKKLDKLHTPKWEIDIIHNAMVFKRNLAHKTLKDLDLLITQNKKLLGVDSNKKC